MSIIFINTLPMFNVHRSGQFGWLFNFDFIYGAFVYLKIPNNRIGRFVSVVNQLSAFGFEFNFSGNVSNVYLKENGLSRKQCTRTLAGSIYQSRGGGGPVQYENFPCRLAVLFSLSSPHPSPDHLILRFGSVWFKLILKYKCCIFVCTSIHMYV